jgi:uncharacterized DUF497 family protein
MEIDYDPEKRAKTLAERGLDFEDAVQIFAGTSLTLEDDRQDYGEKRYQTIGLLNGRLVMVVWTERDAKRHVISMRRCNDRERKKHEGQMGRSG